MIRQILQAGRFDEHAYQALYPDVCLTGALSRFRAFSHWLRHGRHEKRLFPLRGEPSFLRSQPRRIIIDLTSQCNLSCVDCNRLCGPDQAPADDHMHPRQIEYFIEECRRDGRKWDIIRLEGGEPTLNPRFPDIVDLLVAQRRDLFPDGELLVVSNGSGKETRRVLGRFPGGITIVDTRKKGKTNFDHWPIAVAPCDKENFTGHDFSAGCSLPAHFGLGLTNTGFYPHPICGAVDRVFGFNLGLKALPRDDFEDFHKARAKLCRLCGWYLFMGINLHYGGMFEGPEKPGTMSPSWVAAFDRFRENPPVLSVYPGAAKSE